MSPTATVLYRFFNADGLLLYVGITKSTGARFASHNETKEWWPEVRTIQLEYYGERYQAAMAEKIAIRHEDPIHNIVRVPALLETPGHRPSGRPKLPPSEARQRVRSVHLNDAELAEIAEAAATAGVPITRWIRQQVIAEAMF